MRYQWQLYVFTPKLISPYSTTSFIAGTIWGHSGNKKSSVQTGSVRQKHRLVTDWTKERNNTEDLKRVRTC